VYFTLDYIIGKIRLALKHTGHSLKFMAFIS